MNKVLIVQIGYGPTYKKRLLHNLKTENGYDAYDVLILTDDCEYFNELSDKKNMFIVDLDTLRKDYPWSIELEALPEEKRDEVKYAKEILEKNFKFPTLLQRFAFVWDKVYDYDGFIWADADVTPVRNEYFEELMINYFTNKVFTPDNRGLFGLDIDEPKNKIIISPGGGLYDEQHHQYLLSATKKINEKYQITTEEIKHYFIQNDGNFRTFNFPDKTYYKRFFELLNNIVKDTYDNGTEHDYFMLGTHTIWNRASEHILAIVLNLLGGAGAPTNVLGTGLVTTNATARHGTFMVRCFPEDRFWSWGWEVDIEEGSMGFVNRHYDRLKQFYENRGEIWPYNK